MASEVYIHAGGHRTGSSAFQMFLDHNAAAIRAQGVEPLYPSRDGASGGRLKLTIPKHVQSAEEQARQRRRMRRHLDALSGEGRVLLLSEENIPGRMPPMFHGRFFLHARLRLLALREALGARKVARVTLVLRPYDALFLSAYRKISEKRALRDFAALADEMTRFRGGWPQTVALMREVLEPGGIRVLAYRRRPQAEVAREVCPVLDPAPLEEYSNPVNSSLSDAALFALRAHYRAGGARSRALVEELRAAHADETAPAPFAAFTPARKRQLEARFARDWARIAALPGVEAEDLPAHPS